LLIRLVTASDRPSPSVSEAGRAGEQVAVILSTPYMDEAARCHRVGFMQNGRMIAEGTPAKLLSRLEGSIIEVRGISNSFIRQAAGKIDGVEDVRAFGDKIHLRVDSKRVNSVIATLQDVHPDGSESHAECRLVPPTLEDVFISLTESS
jgi:ABC-2 type transport system ATP-binding protein